MDADGIPEEVEDVIDFVALIAMAINCTAQTKKKSESILITVSLAYCFLVQPRHCMKSCQKGYSTLTGSFFCILYDVGFSPFIFPIMYIFSIVYHPHCRCRHVLLTLVCRLP